MNNVQAGRLAATTDPEVIDRMGTQETRMHCGFEPPPEEEEEDEEDGFDIYKSLRCGSLQAAVAQRRGSDDLLTEERYSSVLIVEQAAERFFNLVAMTEPHLRGRFTKEEFGVILNAECTPIWRWDRFTSVATMVADDQGLESLEDLKPGQPLRVLMEKLMELTPLENAVLVDACERVWRGYKNPLL
jgi:hypothetical protein